MVVAKGQVHVDKIKVFKVKRVIEWSRTEVEGMRTLFLPRATGDKSAHMIDLLSETARGSARSADRVAPDTVWSETAMEPIRCTMLGLVKRTMCKMAFSVSRWTELSPVP